MGAAHLEKVQRRMFCSELKMRHDFGGGSRKIFTSLYHQCALQGRLSISHLVVPVSEDYCQERKTNLQNKIHGNNQKQTRCDCLEDICFHDSASIKSLHQLPPHCFNSIVAKCYAAGGSRSIRIWTIRIPSSFKLQWK